ncbi:MAG TPA: hypothetical protein VLF66_13290 [Thermoanaerobaculia bacterium]|nr:hypothetical protein [Thermoanaerobaculia bacterium]
MALELALTAFELGDTAEMAAMVDEASILLVQGAAKQEALAVVRVLMAAIERGAVDRALLAAVAQRVAASKPS